MGSTSPRLGLEQPLPLGGTELLAAACWCCAPWPPGACSISPNGARQKAPNRLAHRRVAVGGLRVVSLALSAWLSVWFPVASCRAPWRWWALD